MTYSEALDAYLKRPEVKVIDLAERVGTLQPNISRYRQGERFPNAEMARKIAVATNGDVSFGLWQAEFMMRSGMDAAA